MADLLRQEYNGWTNYATWIVNTWPTNEQHSYNDLHRRAVAIYDLPISDFRKTLRLSHWYRDYIRDTNSGDSCLAADLRDWGKVHGHNIVWAIKQIDWAYLWDHWSTDIASDRAYVASQSAD